MVNANRPGPPSGRRSGRSTARLSDDQLDDLVTALLTASRALLGVTAQSLAGVDDLVTVPQFRTLVVLETHGPSSLNILAERLKVQPSTALRSVDRLRANDLVTRQENARDRREVVISLTERGRDLVEQVTAVRRRTIAEIAAAMPPGQLRHLVDALTAFAEAAGEPPATGDVVGYL
ncbi:MAG: MarR family transcriptional regulator [Nocardioides sp.]